MRFKLRPGSHFFASVTLSPQAFRRLLVVVLIVWLGVSVSLYFLAEAAAARWAPTAGQHTTGLLVVFVWITQIVPFLKRTRSLLGAMRDGLVYAIGLGALLVVTIHYAG